MTYPSCVSAVSLTIRDNTTTDICHVASRRFDHRSENANANSEAIGVIFIS